MQPPLEEGRYCGKESKGERASGRPNRPKSTLVLLEGDTRPLDGSFLCNSVLWLILEGVLLYKRVYIKGLLSLPSVRIK